MDPSDDWKWKGADCSALGGAAALCEYPSPLDNTYAEEDTDCYMVPDTSGWTTKVAANLDACEEACAGEVKFSFP